MRQLNCKIIENKKVAQRFYKMRIEAPYIARKAQAGQFVEVKCSCGTDPLLRRPLGVHRVLKNEIELLYKAVGRGTELLSKKEKGQALDVIGPLGDGFTLPGPPVSGPMPIILIAGGIGAAPLVALAESLAFSAKRIAYRKKQKTYVLIGAKTKSHILCESEFKKIGCEVKVSTEDGSKGKKCLATELLEDLLNIIRYPLNAAIYACGPVGMLKVVAKIAEGRKLPCQVSLEERMACGVGVCLGCPVKMKGNKYKMVCKDGPVFDAKEIAW